MGGPGFCEVSVYGSADWESALAQAASVVNALRPALAYIGGIALVAVVVDLIRRFVR